MGLRRSVVRSLSARLLLPLLVIVVGILAVHAAVSFHSTQRRFLELASAEADRASRIILRATHDRMLVDPQTDVQRTMDRLAEGGSVAGIRIYDGAGRITQSTHVAEIGQRVGPAVQPCSACHVAPSRGGARRPTKSELVVDGHGRTVLRHLAVIPNEPACSAAGCHAQAVHQPVLGLLDVELSMQPLGEAEAAARRQTLWTLLGLVVFTGGVSTVLIRRLVHRPVRRLYEGTQRLARGDLDARIEVAGPDELAQLAEAFNRMVGELKAAREEVTGWSHRLEEKVVEKTEELQRTQRQVLQMERMASLGKLSATVAHELNNPLTGILTCARLVERELEGQPLPPEVRQELREHLQLIAQESGRCGTIVRNLLLFARQSGGTMGPVDVGRVVERSLALVRHHLQIHGIRLERVLPESGPEIVADAGQVEQALLALLVNAVEAMSGDKGGGVLGLAVEEQDGGVVFHVSDTGVGIHPDVRPHIFEPFFSTKHAESGVGLGLAVVYGIVQRHHGRIEVDSAPGRGTTFRLWLPRQQPAEPSATAKETGA